MILTNEPAALRGDAAALRAAAYRMRPWESLARDDLGPCGISHAAVLIATSTEYPDSHILHHPLFYLTASCTGVKTSFRQLIDSLFNRFIEIRRGLALRLSNVVCERGELGFDLVIQIARFNRLKLPLLASLIILIALCLVVSALDS